MNIWKKAASAGLSATLLASLLATAIAPSVLAAGSATAVAIAVPQDGTSKAMSAVVLTVGAAGDLIAATDLVVTAPAGFEFTAGVLGTATPSAVGILAAASAAAVTGTETSTTVRKFNVTAAGAANAGTGTVTISGLSIRYTGGAADTIDASSGAGTLGTVPLYSLTVDATGAVAGLTADPADGVAADGISSIRVTISGPDAGAADLYTIKTSSGTILHDSGANVTIVNTTTVTLLGTDVASGVEYFDVTSPTSAGTATLSISYQVGGFGLAVADGTATLTFFASSGLDTSPANSVVKVVANGGTCASAAIDAPSQAKGNTTPQVLCVSVKDANGNAVLGTANVAITITPVGLVKNDHTAAGTAQAASQLVNVDVGEAAGIALFGVSGSGIAGTATISVSVTYRGTTTTLGTATVIFTGAVATVTATGVHTAVGVGLSSAGAVTFIAKDAAGNRVDTASSTVVTTGAAFASPSNGGAVTTESTSSTKGNVTVLCGSTHGTGTIAIKSNSITSNAITVNCSDEADTYSVAFSNTTVIPGGTATITVTAKDVNGLPAPDGLEVAIVVSAGAILDTNTVAGETANGVATWTYLAPFNTGVVTVLASADVLTTVSPVSASINVGAAVPVASASAATALGVTTAGPFSTATKVAKLGKYVTVKMSFGASAAGASVAIWRASKNSAGVWSAFTLKTTRIADASGNVYYYVKSSSAAWLSFQGRTSSASTNYTQARWK